MQTLLITFNSSNHRAKTTLQAESSTNQQQFEKSVFLISIIVQDAVFNTTC